MNYKLRSINTLGISLLIFTLPAQSTHASTVRTWSGNGHTYEAILPARSSWNGGWQEAQNIAVSKGGHLATITSQAEMDFVTQLVLDEWAGRNFFGAWLGGFQPAGESSYSTGWQWVTGEPWVYTNWDPIFGKPNGEGNYNIGEAGVLMMWGPYHSQFIPYPDRWSNLCFTCDFSSDGYVIEYENYNNIDEDSDGYTRINDCNDNDASIFPGASELCDGKDNNCDGIVPENENDQDGDGYRICNNDCKDSNLNIHPNATELPGNFVDENCDGNLGECNPCKSWRNHGEYVRCVAHAVEGLTIPGTLPEEEGDALVTSAAHSDVGKKDYTSSECQ